MEDYAVRFKNLSKVYKLYKDDKDRFKDLFWGKRYTPFRALNDVTLDLPKGEVIGILGTNGSGKSTILKVVTGVVYPTSGEVDVVGKVSALLELTAGFDQELTGRENIYLKGYSMGMVKKEVEDILEEVIDFSELGDYIEQPVRMYSSGMKARLGFAIAVNIDPDILVVDEALSVGDEAFRNKCLERMDKFRDDGKTILFVSHSLPQMRDFCTIGFWLYHGEVVAYGDIDEIANLYRHYLNGVPIEDIMEDMDKYKDLVEIKQTLQEVKLTDHEAIFKGFVDLEPLTKEYKLLNITLREDEREYPFSDEYLKCTRSKEPRTNRYDYELRIPLDEIPKGFFNFELNVDVHGERYIRQAWCQHKFGEFLDSDHRLEITIKSNRMKVRRG